MVAEANANTDVAAAGGQSGMSQDSATSYQRDVVKDTGTDERYQVTSADRADVGYANIKRTYDLHQTQDGMVLSDERLHKAKLNSIELAEREQRIRFAEEEHQQRLAHADFLRMGVNAAISKEIVEVIADRTAEKVCEAQAKAA